MFSHSFVVSMIYKKVCIWDIITSFMYLYLKLIVVFFKG